MTAARELGADGRFGIERNLMGVPGLHLAFNVFSEQVCDERMYGDRVFTDDVQDFVHQSDPPLKMANLHPLMRDRQGGSAWPDDWHRIINAVRECGLYPQAVIPDNAYGLTYPTGSNFPCHWDSRGKWGEYVISTSLGQRSVLTMQHIPNKANPFDGSFQPQQLPTDAYYTSSMVHAMKAERYQVRMTLPPNSIYVMSGAARLDWRHGVRAWEHGGSQSPPRRAIIYRSTKVYSEMVLRRELGRSHANGQPTEDIEARLVASAVLPTETDNPNYRQDGQAVIKLREPDKVAKRTGVLTQGRVLDPGLLAAMQVAAGNSLDEILDGSAHRLRFRMEDAGIICNTASPLYHRPLSRESAVSGRRTR
jgi:hypothetical protein